MSDQSKPFAIVEFDDSINDKKSVELVLVFWLTEDETMCFWPPKNKEHKVPEYVKSECAPGSTWRTYHVEIISKAKDYEQGLRRLNRSFQKKDVGSSESESQSSKKDHLLMMDSSTVARVLSNPIPLNNERLNNRLARSRSLGRADDIEEVFEDDKIAADDDLIDVDTTSHKSRIENQQSSFQTASKTRVEPKGIVDFDGLAAHIEKFIAAEIDKMKRSLFLTLANRYDKILKAVEYKADPPQKTQAWKEIGAKLPFENIEDFSEFEESLKTDEQKQNALLDIFQMTTAGSTAYEDDIPEMIAKMIKKSIQLQYSGCGKKAKGIGKKSFKETETFKLMEKFLKARYQVAKNPLKMVSAVSRFLAGANDRDGGRAQRGKETQPLVEQ